MPEPLVVFMEGSPEVFENLSQLCEILTLHRSGALFTNPVIQSPEHDEVVGQSASSLPHVQVIVRYSASCRGTLVIFGS